MKNSQKVLNPDQSYAFNHFNEFGEDSHDYDNHDIRNDDYYYY